MAAYTSGTAYVNHRDHDTGTSARATSRTSSCSTPTPSPSPPTRSTARRWSTWIEGEPSSTPAPPDPEEPSCPLPTHSRARAGAAAAAIVAGSLGAALALSACTAPEPDTDADVDWELTTTTDAPSGDIDSYTWVSYAEPYSLDYAYAFDYADNQVLANVCESLLRLNPDYTLSPGLAESFEHPTPETWVYTIRDGVTFHDGTPLTAADVVASMNRHLDPAVGLVVVLGVPERGLDRADRRPPGHRDRGIRPTRSSTSRWAARPASSSRRPRSPRRGRRLRQLDRRRELHRAVQPRGVEVGRVASRSQRYDDYWDDALRAQSGEVEFIFMNDANARVNALKSGEVDGGWMVPMDAVRSSRRRASATCTSA